MLSEFLTKHASNSPIMFVTLKRFAVHFFCCPILKLTNAPTQCTAQQEISVETIPNAKLSLKPSEVTQ